MPACPFGTRNWQGWRLYLPQPPPKTKFPSLRQHACVLLCAAYSAYLFQHVHSSRGIYLVYSGKSQAFSKDLQCTERLLAQVQRRKRAKRACSQCFDLVPLFSWPLLGRLLSTQSSSSPLLCSGPLVRGTIQEKAFGACRQHGLDREELQSLELVMEGARSHLIPASLPFSSWALKRAG